MVCAASPFLGCCSVICLEPEDFYSPTKTSLLYGFGNLGVQVFFVISGYLTTHLLLFRVTKIQQNPSRKVLFPPHSSNIPALLSNAD